MDDELILALVVQHFKTKEISVMSLTQNYKFDIVAKEAGGRTTTIAISESTSTIGSSLESETDSVTVIYGENGEGKTALLLDVCRTLSSNTRHHPLGTIWRDAIGGIHLNPGSDQRAIKLTGHGTTKEPRKQRERFGSVFYTTSPFESARRRQLATEGTIDVTPSFGTNSFNGTSLCQATASLPKDIPFIRQAKVQLEIRHILDIEDEIEKFIFALSPFDSERSVSKRSERENTYAKKLQRLGQSLSVRTQSLLAIELLRARLDGPKAAKTLLLDLFSRNSALTGSQAIGRFLSRRKSDKYGRVITPHILRSIENLRRETASKSPTKLMDHARLLGSKSPTEISGLQEAENLGLLRWNFFELSSGQVALLMLFASLSSALEALSANGTKHVAIVIDEGEMFMHPAWQRKYLRDIMKFISRYRKSFKEIHLILATHSLIVAGDTPPNRLFDVKSGKMRNGFAHGPKEILSDIYGVQEFSGYLTENLYEKIIYFFESSKATSITNEEEAKDLINQIASSHLKAHLLEELNRRTQEKHA